MYNFQCDIVSYKNTKANDKPNEDLVVYDDKIQVGLLIDGVSRDREQGVYPLPSPAAVACDIFSKKVISSCNENDIRGILRLQYAIESANEDLRLYNAELKHRFPAGTVGICFAIEEDLFYYGYVGDCYAAIIRNGMMRIFTECQTQMVAKHKKEFTSDEIRFQICNNIAHPCGYGVWDGNRSSMDFTKFGVIRVMAGDVILVYSDGLEAEVENVDMKSISSKSLSSLFGSNERVNLDDRSCLRIIASER